MCKIKVIKHTGYLLGKKVIQENNIRSTIKVCITEIVKSIT